MNYSISEKLNILKHANRANAKSYIDLIFTDFMELSGDRLYGDDPSIIGGIGFIDNIPLTVIGQLRGKKHGRTSQIQFFNDTPGRLPEITTVDEAGRKIP